MEMAGLWYLKHANTLSACFFDAVLPVLANLSQNQVLSFKL